MTYPELEAIEQLLLDRWKELKGQGIFDVHAESITTLFWATNLLARHLKEKEPKRKIKLKVSKKK